MKTSNDPLRWGTPVDVRASTVTWGEKPSFISRVSSTLGIILTSGLYLVMGAFLCSTAIYLVTGTRTPPLQQIQAAAWGGASANSAPTTAGRYEINGFVFTRKAHVLQSPHFYATWNGAEATPGVVRAALDGAEAAYAELGRYGYAAPATGPQFNGKVPIIFARRPFVHGGAVNGYAPEIAFDTDKRSWRSGVVINSSMDSANTIRRVTAHEVFHAVQFTYLSTPNFQSMWSNSSGNWFLESSADWFAYLTYPQQAADGLEAFARESRGVSLLPSAAPVRDYVASIDTKNYFAWVLLRGYTPVATAEAKVLQVCFRSLKCAGITPQEMLRALTGEKSIASILVRGLQDLPLSRVVPRFMAGPPVAPWSWDYYRAQAAVTVSSALLTCGVINGRAGACVRGYTTKPGENVLVINPSGTRFAFP